MIHLEQAGAHTRLGSTLCAACPHSAAGCCVGPPDLGWSDIGRIVQRGGCSFLLGEIRAGNLMPGPSGLSIRRVRKKESALLPRRLKCVYHGPQGCTITPDQRPATCNYYLCADAFAEHRGHPDIVARAREVHTTLRSLYTRWDGEIADRVAATWPDPLAWEEALLDWLGQCFDELSARDPAGATSPSSGAARSSTSSCR
jgi:hypothetical protein